MITGVARLAQYSAPGYPTSTRQLVPPQNQPGWHVGLGTREARGGEEGSGGEQRGGEEQRRGAEERRGEEERRRGGEEKRGAEERSRGEQTRLACWSGAPPPGGARVAGRTSWREARRGDERPGRRWDRHPRQRRAAVPQSEVIRAIVPLCAIMLHNAMIRGDQGHCVQSWSTMPV